MEETKFERAFTKIAPWLVGVAMLLGTALVHVGCVEDPTGYDGGGSVITSSTTADEQRDYETTMMALGGSCKGWASVPVDCANGIAAVNGNICVMKSSFFCESGSCMAAATINLTCLANDWQCFTDSTCKQKYSQSQRQKIYCDGVSHQCKTTPVSCEDGNPCTVNWWGDSGCVWAPVSCEDGNACTTDSCQPWVGCKNTTKSGCCLTSGECSYNSVCTSSHQCEVVAPKPENPNRLFTMSLSLGMVFNSITLEGLYCTGLVMRSDGRINFPASGCVFWNANLASAPWATKQFTATQVAPVGAKYLVFNYRLGTSYGPQYFCNDDDADNNGVANDAFPSWPHTFIAGYPWGGAQLYYFFVRGDAGGCLGVLDLTPMNYTY